MDMKTTVIEYAFYFTPPLIYFTEVVLAEPLHLEESKPEFPDLRQ